MSSDATMSDSDLDKKMVYLAYRDIFKDKLAKLRKRSKVRNVVEKHTLTYQSGKFAGDMHGREEHAYIPWQFNLPDAGYESAWKFLMDRDYFFADYGPATVERNDPMFLLKNSCCWWSGQSWPYSTAQTLTSIDARLKTTIRIPSHVLRAGPVEERRLSRNGPSAFQRRPD